MRMEYVYVQMLGSGRFVALSYGDLHSLRAPPLVWKIYLSYHIIDDQGPTGRALD